MSTYLEINKIILSCAAWAKTSFSKDSQRELKIPSEAEQQDMGNLKRGGKEAKYKMSKNEFKLRISAKELYLAGEATFLKDFCQAQWFFQWPLKPDDKSACDIDWTNLQIDKN